MIMDVPVMLIIAVHPKGERNACVDHQNVVVLLVDVLLQLLMDRHGAGKCIQG